jgi:uncharacterized phage protein gp47/JayE
MPADFPSRLDLHALARTYVLTRASKIDPAQVDIAGSDINLFVGITSVVGFQIVLALMQSINTLLLDGAYDEDLDRYGFDRYQLTRKGAAPALGQGRIFRSSAAAGAGTVPANTSVLTLNGIEYVTTTSATFGAATLSATCDVRATQAGKQSQVGANMIRQFAKPGDFWDQTLQINNDLPTAGGEDVEDDDTFRERIRDFWNAARRGTLSAIELGARNTSGIVSAQAEEVLTAEPQPARVVLLRAADSSGSSSAALGATVIASLDEYRAAGIAVILSTTAPQLISIVLKLTFAGNVNTTLLTENIRGAVVEYVNSLGVGQTLLKADIFSVLKRFTSAGLIVKQDSMVSPTGDLVPGTGMTLRTRFTDVTVV